MSDPAAKTVPILGIIAGGGRLPGLLVQACRDHGRDFRLVALKDQFTDDKVPVSPDAVFRVGQVGAITDFLRKEGAREIVFGGAVRRPSLGELRPDALAAKAIARAGVGLLGDDGLLSAVVRLFEAEGFGVVAPDSILDGLLANAGVFGAHRPDAPAQCDIERGLTVLQTTGILDIGQAIVVQEGQVLGLEAVEGTDQLVERCGELQKDAPGGVLVKIAKPQQERRVDLPTIGLETVERAAAAGLRGIAVEAGGTLVIDRPAIVKLADRLGLFVTGISVDGNEDGQTR